VIIPLQRSRLDSFAGGCTILVGVGGLVSQVTRVRLIPPIGGATGGSGNLSTSLSNVAKLAAHPKFAWVFNANYDGTIIYNALYITTRDSDQIVNYFITFNVNSIRVFYIMLSLQS
jgi:hypothetical protein